MKYETKVTGWGDMALDFLVDDPTEAPFLVIFNNNAPEEIAEICVLHDMAELKADPAVGDTVTLGSHTYKVTAVGDEALHTLRTLGHCTLKFKADSEPEMPGCIMLDGKVPDAGDITVGMIISIG